MPIELLWVTDRFQRSGETTNRHFHNVLNALTKFAKEIIVPPSFDRTPLEISTNRKYMSWFKDCIGAIDRTHISAVIPTSDQVPYRSGRKGNTTQNVMTVYSFDMRLTWIWAGWERSAHDSRIFNEAIYTSSLHFPRPPPGIFYISKNFKFIFYLKTISFMLNLIVY